MKIIPTIFAHNKKEFQKRFKKILPIARNIQIDFMDGKFVKAKSISLNQISPLEKYHKNFEAHLMYVHPEKYFLTLKQKGFKKIIFHIEATNNPEETIEKIKSLKMKPMVAINPETNIRLLPQGADILFMGVHPGKEHQKFIPQVYKKIQQLRKISKKIQIQVDGGVTPTMIKQLAKLGVNAVNSGSYISNSENPKEAIKKLNACFR